jgi:Zn-dependent protease
MNIAFVIFELAALIFSAVLHEIAHGYMAERLGDDTARRAGRLTLNPLKHLDPFGSVLLPILLYLGTGGAFIFATAKPVPYDPRNLRNPRSGSAKIAIAGPATNFLLAAVFGIIIRIFSYLPVSDIFIELLGIVVLVNLVLGIFNLIPIPPLDGSRVLFAALPPSETTARAMYFLERWGILLVLLFAFFGFALIQPLIGGLFRVLTGISLGF